MLYAFFWVIPRHLNFICRRFGTLCLFHLHTQVYPNISQTSSFLTPTCLWRWNKQCVPERWHIKFRCREITQKKAYNIQNTAKVWNQERDHMSLKENCTLIFVLPSKKNKTCFAQQLSISTLYKSNSGSFFMKKDRSKWCLFRPLTVEPPSNGNCVEEILSTVGRHYNVFCMDLRTYSDFGLIRH